MSQAFTKGTPIAIDHEDRPPLPANRRPEPVSYAARPAPQAHAPTMTMQQTVISVGSQKSVAGAVILALLFGPLGMLYATVLGGVVMFFATLIIAVPTLGLGLLLTVPVGAIWAGVAASGNNRHIASGMSQMTASVSASPPAPTR